MTPTIFSARLAPPNGRDEPGRSPAPRHPRSPMTPHDLDNALTRTRRHFFRDCGVGQLEP